jgi:hypothetical protein
MFLPPYLYRPCKSNPQNMPKLRKVSSQFLFEKPEGNVIQQNYSGLVFRHIFRSFGFFLHLNKADDNTIYKLRSNLKSQSRKKHNFDLKLTFKFLAVFKAFAKAVCFVGSRAKTSSPILPFAGIVENRSTWKLFLQKVHSFYRI